MRNWNVSAATCFASSVLYIFTLPMRNWNKFAISIVKNPSQPFLLYLWGIETSNFYFEAKKIAIFLLYLWGIETTPWRAFAWPWCGLEFLLYLWGIETILDDVNMDKISNIFTLPMRNWNIEISFRKVQGLAIFTLPMRNWNTRYAFYGYHTHLHFYFTYEELKPKLSKAMVFNLSLFLLYL